MPVRFLLSLLASVAVLSGCVTNPSTGRSQWILLNAQEVAAIGVEAKPAVIAEFGGEVASAPLRAYVDRVGWDVAGQVESAYAGTDWEFIVLDSDVLNAFALPGGKVFITRGLLSRLENEAEVAGVLGHEIGHVTARHVDERLSQAMTAQLGLSILGAYSESELVNLGAQVAASGALLKFSRDQESEADLQGLKYMTAAGYDPAGLREVLEVLLEAARGSARQPELFSTHPNPETRLRSVREKLKGPYAYTQNNPAFRLDADRFDREAKPYLGP